MQKGIKTFTTWRAAIVSVLISAAFLWFMGAAPVLPAYTLSCYALMAAPVVIMLTGPLAGLIPMAISAGMTLGMLFATGGFMLFAFGTLYLVPMTVLYAYCLLQRKNFWVTIGMVTGALSGMLIVMFVILQSMTGWQLYATVGDAVAGYLRDMPYRDGMLSLLCQMGMLQVPASMQDTALVAVEGGYVFSAEVTQELLRQARTVSMVYVQQMLPSMLISGSVLNTLMGVSFGIYYGKRAAQRRAFKRNEPEQDIPDLNMPPLSQWYIPRPWGSRIGILAVGYVLTSIATNDTIYMMGAMMWQVFYVCFAVQGLASVHYNQKKRGTGRFWRTALIVAAMMIPTVQTVLMVMGVFDQINNYRGLRPPLQPRNNGEV